jgi:predicted enzyme related to lactoylglutathione lyase
MIEPALHRLHLTPKHSIGEWGFMADFADPEGNVITLWEKSKK